MSVITISRGTFSGGKRLAECLAGHLGYRCVDREVIVERAAADGASYHEIRAALDSPPGFLERFSHKRYLYLALIQAALTEEVRRGNVVYHGHAGHLLLKGGSPVLRARIIAPMEYRIANAEERLKMNRGEALSYIRKVDSDRRKWARYLYGVDLCDSSLFDLVINLEHIDIEEGCNILASTAKNQKCFHFDARCQAAMDDLARSSRIKADLALNKTTSNLELEVFSEAGAVRIGGKVFDTNQIEEIERVARRVAGVTTVSLDDLAPPTPD